MTSTVIENIGLLLTHDEERPEISAAALVFDEGRVAWWGASADAPAADRRVDAAGRCVLPGFVDSHSHILFAGDRSDEFEARMAGRRYEAGGIRRTVALSRVATDAELLANAAALVAEMRRQGTTTVEIKSGYGLSVADEARMLRLAATLTDETTFLGAHVVPAEYADDRAAYVHLVMGDMLEACAPHSRWIDVFCDSGAFTEAETRAIITAGQARGLGARLHGAQLAESGAVQLAVELGAASVDHCTYLSDDDVQALAGSSTVAGLLPGVEFSTKHPFVDARRLLDAGVTVALASDCNPGSSFTSSLPFCIALAVREMGMTSLEAVTAATLGGAESLRRDDVGRLAVGARANAQILDAPHYRHLAYRPGVPLVSSVFVDGVHELVRPLA
ncbi:imidazolonepropionase [Salinibacterium sp. NSLL150]|uniref:imidazolonepropionase n=1 Tax=unclassified Salinibacterium TaxID=2632331 RepID=UPI0018CEA13B|nr:MULTISPECIES: imidazolonepropionase [unclassified Salinibacterium]MBH0098225.1 imidazolonepropionase [Salinibacterium sp. NSLL35]MBH0100980.1 imidazolonepropionase [Salinibacterium sp. NSLL150]MBH0103739.1 imidazolonepropionase [Salinibacterium sp. NSLL16]MBH0106500.1 imidazolonepropionase [Salinibacterium sp. NSLL17]